MNKTKCIAQWPSTSYTANYKVTCWLPFVSDWSSWCFSLAKTCFTFDRCCAKSPVLVFEKAKIKQSSHCARHRKMSSGVTAIEHIDLTAVFTYRLMSCDVRHRVMYDITTTLTQKLNLVHFLRVNFFSVARCRMTSCDTRMAQQFACRSCRAQCEHCLTVSSFLAFLWTI